MTSTAAACTQRALFSAPLAIPSRLSRYLKSGPPLKASPSSPPPKRPLMALLLALAVAASAKAAAGGGGGGGGGGRRRLRAAPKTLDEEASIALRATTRVSASETEAEQAHRATNSVPARAGSDLSGAHLPSKL